MFPSENVSMCTWPIMTILHSFDCKKCGHFEINAYVVLFFTQYIQIIFIYLYITVRFRGKTKKCRITLAFMRCFVVFRRKWINTGQEFRSMYMNKKRSHYCQNSSVVRCYGDKNKRENTLLKHSMNEIYSLHRITITIWLLEKR